MIRTRRLVLRHWTPTDLGPFAAINADPAVTEHLLGPLSRSESDALVARIEAGFVEHGFGLWAVEQDGLLVGMVGLAVPRVPPPQGPCVEVAWRLARRAWGRGLATEAAAAAITHGRTLGVGEVVSFTSITNTRSQRVMQRLGMSRDPAEDFDCPAVPVGSPLRRHVLYRLPADRPPGLGDG